MPRSVKASADRTPNRGLLTPFERNLLDYEARPLPTTARRVLAVDPGLGNIAVALVVMDKDDDVNPVDILTTKFDLPAFTSIFAKLHYLSCALDLWIREYSPDVIVKEGVAHFSKFGVADAGRIQQMIETVAYAWELPVVTVNPQTMRAFIGSKQKSDTKLKVWQRYGREFGTEDETDAFAIAMTGLAAITGNLPGKKPKKTKTSKKAS